MEEFAGWLAEAYRADPSNGILARELRMTLQALAAPGKTDDGLGDLYSALREA
jgi:hypothetical protein